MDYGLFVLAEWVESQKQYVDYQRYDDRDAGKAEAFQEVLDQIKAMRREVKRWGDD